MSGPSKLLLLLCTVSVFLLFAAGAQANFWGPGGTCYWNPANKAHHCYALEEWHMAGYPREYGDGAVLAMDTMSTDVPGWASGDEVNDEMWLLFGANDYIDTYLTVMHGHFTSQRVPKGQAPVQGTVMAVITDAHTGFVDTTFIGLRTPTASGMTAVSITEPAVATTASVALGVIAGRLIESGSPPHADSKPSPVVGWHVLIGKGQLLSHTSHIIATLTTRAGGRFAIHVKPGKYLIAGMYHAQSGGRAGEICPSKHVTVRAGKRSHVVIECQGTSAGAGGSYPIF